MLIVHGGFHKTGSTSIQNELRAGGFGDIQFLASGYWELKKKEPDPGFVSAMRSIPQSRLTVASSEATYGTMTSFYADASDRARGLAEHLSGIEWKTVVFVRPIHE